MKRGLLLILLSVIGLTSYSQVKFEKGYFIDNKGVKTLCLINVPNLKYNPTKFDYKITEDATLETHTIMEIKEFGTSDDVKFERYTVKIDRSSDNLSLLSKSVLPEFYVETLFLKEIVSGKASLFSYKEEDLVRFFFKVDDNAIEQLIYKSYLLGEKRFGVNNKYRQQLWINMKFSGFKLSHFKRLRYRKRDLLKYFNKYNTFLGSK
ncbi:MAG: hypothetical protein WBG43_01245 [Marinifilaceae bacterium]